MLKNICDAHGNHFIEGIAVAVCNAQPHFDVFPDGNRLEGADVDLLCLIILKMSELL